MPYLVSQYDHTHGEASPLYTGRPDLSMYSKSASLIKNMMVKPNGSLVSRFGTKNVKSLTGALPVAFETWSFGNGDNVYDYAVVVQNTIITLINLETFAPTLISTTINVLEKIRIIQQQNYLVILSGSSEPILLTGDLTTGIVTNDTLTFSIPPTFEFDNKYAYGSTFTLEVVERTAPGTATSSLPILEITNMGTFGGFTADFVGGQFTSLGPTSDDEDGFATIEEYISSTQVRVRVKNPFQKIPGWTSGVEGSFNGSECNLTQKAYTSTTGYPTAGCFFQNRLFLAGGERTPQTIFGSKVGDFDNFSLGTGLDDEGLQSTISGQGDVILNVVASKTLQIFTKYGEYSNGLWEAKVLTPSTFNSISLQSSYGSKDVEPVSIDNQTIFCKGGGNAIMSFAYPVGATAYQSSNLSFYSEHLINNPIKLATLSNNTHYDSNTLFVLNNDNTLNILEMLPEQEVFAWSRFVSNDQQEGKQYINICSLRDRVFILSDISSTYYIEEIKKYPLDFYTDQKTITGTTVQLGLDYGNKTVHVIDTGGDENINTDSPHKIKYFGSFETDGNGDFDMGTITASELDQAIFGFAFEQHVRSMPLHIMTQNGDNRYLKKKLSKVYVEYLNSYSFKIGTEYPSQLSDDPDNSSYWAFNSIQVPIYKYSTTSSPTITYDQQYYSSKSGVFETDINSGHSRNTYISIKQDLPLPLEILGYAAHMSI